jgi:hypothetical protein
MQLSISVNNFALLIKAPVLHLRAFFAPANLIAFSLGLAVSHPARIAVAARQKMITLIPLYRVPLVGLNGRKLVPALQGFCHGAVPFLICSISREATFLTKASLFISLTQSRLRSHERL